MFVYVLKCFKPNGSVKFYKGITNNLKRRLKEHINKKSTYTKRFCHIELIYTEKYKTRSEARQREIELKKLSLKQLKNLF